MMSLAKLLLSKTVQLLYAYLAGRMAIIDGHTARHTNLSVSLPKDTCILLFRR